MSEDLVTVADEAPRPRRGRAVGESDDDVLKVEEVAAWLQCSPRVAWDLVAKGKLRSIKVAGLRRVKRAWVKDYLDRRR